MIFAVVTAAHFFQYQFSLDDAFISARYGAHFFSYGIPTWNNGDPNAVMGYTNFAWMALQGVMHHAGMEILLASRLVSILIFTFFFIRILKLAEEMGMPRAWRIFFPGAWLLINPTLIFYTNSGLESSVLGIGAAWLFISVFLNEKPSRFDYIVGTLLPMLHPEGAAYTIFWLAALWVTGKLDRNNFIGLLLIWGAYLLWTLAVFGSPIPNTYYVKVEDLNVGQKALVSIKYAFIWLKEFPDFYIFVFSPFLLKLVGRRALWLITPLIVNMVVLFVIGDDEFPYFRFFIPSIVAGSVVGVVCLAELLKSKRSYFHAGMAFIAILMSWQVLHRPWKGIDPAYTRLLGSPADHLRCAFGVPGRLSKFIYDEEYVYSKIAKSFSPFLDDNSTIAIGQAGAIPYSLDKYRFYDVAFLNDNLIRKGWDYAKKNWYELRRPTHLILLYIPPEQEINYNHLLEGGHEAFWFLKQEHFRNKFNLYVVSPVRVIKACQETKTKFYFEARLYIDSETYPNMVGDLPIRLPDNIYIY